MKKHHPKKHKNAYQLAALKKKKIAQNLKSPCMMIEQSAAYFFLLYRKTNGKNWRLLTVDSIDSGNTSGIGFTPSIRYALWKSSLQLTLHRKNAIHSNCIGEPQPKTTHYITETAIFAYNECI